MPRSWIREMLIGLKAFTSLPQKNTWKDLAIPKAQYMKWGSRFLLIYFIARWICYTACSNLFAKRDYTRLMARWTVWGWFLARCFWISTLLIKTYDEYGLRWICAWSFGCMIVENNGTQEWQRDIFLSKSRNLYRVEFYKQDLRSCSRQSKSIAFWSMKCKASFEGSMWHLRVPLM